MLFLGIPDAETALRWVARDKGRFHAAVVGPLAALCAELPAAPPSLFGRKTHVLQRLVETQRLLEFVAEQGPILAATPGVEIDGPDAVLAALGGDLALFETMLDRHGFAREYQVTIAWDARASLRALAEREQPELILARRLGREAFGAAIASAMAAERARLGDWSRTMLQAAALDTLDLPTRDEDQIANVVAMIDAKDTNRLDAALERIDAELAGEPRIRCVGPLPALSFVAVELKRIDAAAAARARELLDVAPEASLETLKSAFRAQAKTAHPDAGGDPARFKALVEARTLLAAFADRGGADAIASIRLAAGGRP